MKRTFPRTLPLLAVLAATLAAPVAAQDISSILNPGNFAARLNTGANPAFANLPSDMSGLFAGPNVAARLHPSAGAQIAALAPAAQVQTSRLAPLTSMAPVPRGGIARVMTPAVEIAPSVAAPADGPDLVTAMAAAADAAPAGSNTFVVNGAVIASEPSAVEAPRRTLWQRLFGS
ncbi:hypothetical protein [Gymnodinialimonas sp.]